jgi:chromosome segregation ATPase
MPRNVPDSNVKEPSALVSAARALEAELLSLESITRAARKIPLSSEKNITRAAKELEQALALPERMANGLQALAAAMATMQARQQAALEPLAALAAQIQSRHRRLGELMEAYAALGRAAAEITTSIQAGEGEPAVVSSQVEEQLSRIAVDAKTLFEAAHADDFPELAREADALKQRASSLRRRLDSKS